MESDQVSSLDPSALGSTLAFTICCIKLFVLGCFFPPTHPQKPSHLSIAPKVPTTLLSTSLSDRAPRRDWCLSAKKVPIGKIPKIRRKNMDSFIKQLEKHLSDKEETPSHFVDWVLKTVNRDFHVLNDGWSCTRTGEFLEYYDATVKVMSAFKKLVSCCKYLKKYPQGEEASTTAIGVPTAEIKVSTDPGRVETRTVYADWDNIRLIASTFLCLCKDNLC